jgi:L-ascorbate oxidase
MKLVSRRTRLGVFLVVGLSMCLVRKADAQNQRPRIAGNPPLLTLVRKAAPGARLGDAPAPSHEATLDLNIVYTDGQMFNPATGLYDKVRLRSYQGTQVDPANPFISPMLDINPGDTIRVNLNNKLPKDEGCTKPSGGVNKPHCFNGTNLHTHGLWVNPAGNSDNVLISINPGVSFQYEYNIPSDHPAGTFWYHTHRHGSTALQVASGMAGALIIRGNRPPTATQNGDIDTLLKPTSAQAFKERVLVMQQIQYACRGQNGAIKVNSDKTWKCDPGDVGGIESYDQFGPGSWPESGRYTSINGQVLPTLPVATAGQIERWRVIHGGVRDTINLQFRKLRQGAGLPKLLRANQQDSFVGQNCTGAPLPQHLIAADGLTTSKVIRNEQTVYQPAYRWDSLMVFPSAGIYCVVDAAVPAGGSVNQAAVTRDLLGFVTVDAGTNVPGNATDYLTSQLVAAAGVNMPVEVRAKVIADLQNGLSLASFVPHKDVAPGELTGTQQLVFNIDVSTSPPTFEVNGNPFDPNRVDRTLMLGGVEEWTLTSDFVSHPFHIHVNPFQVVKILDPAGRDVSDPDVPDTAGGVDPQYRGLKGVWKDTLWVKNNTKTGTAGGKYTITVRTRYQRYIGDYVLHCHILDHEDQGMMQIIRVALPDGAGGTAAGHGH